uniref:Myosin tail domain-containing protein n=1 Tax=Xenopus tropicalis TaxID=8364 RepID=A0A1B8Y3C4_XENTR
MEGTEGCTLPLRGRGKLRGAAAQPPPPLEGNQVQRLSRCPSEKNALMEPATGPDPQPTGCSLNPEPETAGTNAPRALQGQDLKPIEEKDITKGAKIRVLNSTEKEGTQLKPAGPRAAGANLPSCENKNGETKTHGTILEAQKNEAGMSLRNPRGDPGQRGEGDAETSSEGKDKVATNSPEGRTREKRNSFTQMGANQKESLEEEIKRKDAEINTIGMKVEEQRSVSMDLQRKNKEYLAHIEELEEELEAERNIRAKIEKQRSDLANEVDDLHDKLEETAGFASSQVEINKKREVELVRLRQELEEALLQSEGTASALRKKHAASLVEATEQHESMQRARMKLEKEKQNLKGELEELAATAENLQKAKVRLYVPGWIYYLCHWIL